MANSILFQSYLIPLNRSSTRKPALFIANGKNQKMITNIVIKSAIILLYFFNRSNALHFIKIKNINIVKSLNIDMADFVLAFPNVYISY